MSTSRIPKRPSKAKNSEIDQLIAEINELPKVLWLATVLLHYVPGECSPILTVVRNLDPAVVDYLDQFPNVDLACTQHVEDCRSVAKRAGILAGARNPETADVHWFDCLLRHSPRFQRYGTGGWLDDFPSATIELLQRLKRAGTMSELAVAAPPNTNDDQDEPAGQETFDLNKPPVRQPYVHQDYPFLLYHHASGKTQAAQDAEERRTLLAEGWSEDPYPAAAANRENPAPASALAGTEESQESMTASMPMDDQAAESPRRPGRPRSTPNLHPDVEVYLDRVSKHVQRRITIPDFCLVTIGSSDDTYFGFWRNGDPRCPEAYAKSFERTLALSSEQFLERLKSRKRLPGA